MGTICCAFTICVQDRKKLFLSKEIFDPVSDILLDALDKNNCKSHVYIFMPDH